MKVCAIGLRGVPDVMGGIETHCENLYLHLTRLYRDVEIVVLGRKGYVQGRKEERIQVIPLWAPRSKGLESLIHTPLALLYARLFIHPAIIHLHAIGPGFFAPMARLLGFRVVATHHARDYDRPKWGRFGRWFLKAGEWMVATFANDVVCVSRDIEKGLAAKYPAGRERYVTIRNGVPAPKVETFSDEPLLASLGLAATRYMLCVGRLDPTKGFEDAVAAYAGLKSCGTKLVVVGDAIGDADYASALRASAPPGVVFAGARPAAEVRALYRNADLFIHPSYMEGFPLVVLEALAADAPIIVSDIDAHREVGLDRANYFRCGDREALANVMKLASFEYLRCSRRAEILAENDWEKIARRHYDLFVRREGPSKTAAVQPTFR